MRLETITVPESVRRLQSIQIQQNIKLADVARQTKPRRRSWTETIRELIVKPNGSVVVAKAARTSIGLAARRMGVQIRTQEIDPYHVRVAISQGS